MGCGSRIHPFRVGVEYTNIAITNPAKRVIMAPHCILRGRSRAAWTAVLTSDDDDDNIFSHFSSFFGKQVIGDVLYTIMKVRCLIISQASLDKYTSTFFVTTRIYISDRYKIDTIDKFPTIPTIIN